MNDSEGRPKIYFSLRSPYSWLACHDLLAGAVDTGRFAWRPVWEPDALSTELLAAEGGSFPYSPMSRAKHMYALADVARLAAERGMRPRWPVDRDPCWEVPHLAYLLAAECGQGMAFIEAAHRSRWLDGRDICDRSVVADLAGDLGLDATDLAGATESPQVRAAGIAALLAVHRDGVFGVPFFIVGRQRFWGIDRLSRFLSALDDVPPSVEQELPDPLPPAAGFDDGHAGGCG